jgi:hypothetical protein
MSASGKASHSGFRLGTSDKSRFQEAAGRNRTSEMGSLCEFRLLAKNPLKPPGDFGVRPSARVMAARGWIPEWRLLLA